MPSWDDLIDELQKQIGMNEKQINLVKNFNVLDKANILDLLLKSKNVPDLNLSSIISKRLNVNQYSLSHSLLSSLPTSEVVTTNYDTLFELASNTSEKRLRVLPYEPFNPDSPINEKWLLKLHGCINHPEDIGF